MTQYTMADAQELFNIAYLGLASQDFKKSYSPDDSSCAYRGSGGLKCAIGHIIQDDALANALDATMGYLPEQKSGYSISALLEGSFPLDKKVQEIFDPSPELINFLRELQKVHDDSLAYGISRYSMKNNLHAFATSYKLSIPAIIPTVPAPQEQPNQTK